MYVITYAEVTLVRHFSESVLADHCLQQSLVVPLVEELVAGVSAHFFGSLKQFVLALSLFAHDLLWISFRVQHFHLQ